MTSQLALKKQRSQTQATIARIPIIIYFVCAAGPSRVILYSPKISRHYFCEFCEKIPVRENIIVNMLFPYISTMMTYLVREKLNAKILF